VINTSLLTGRKIIDPDKLLFKKFGLSKRQRAIMLAFGLALAQVASPIGSACYFLWTQAHYLISYPEANGTNGSLVNVQLKDSWDRLPVHIDNLIGVNWFGTAVHQTAPLWWVVARHDFRKVLIGFIAALLIGAVTVGLKKRKRRTPAEMVMSVPVALVAAGLTAGALIAAFTKLLPVLTHVGVVSSNPWLSEWLGRGQVELLVIGFLSGMTAKMILARTFDTIQLMSLERNISQEATERWWWKFVYPPNYRNRFDLLVENGYECEAHSRWLGLTLTFGAPVLMFLAGFGIWLNYFGPAAGAAH
jgi:hypothetical protein